MVSLKKGLILLGLIFLLTSIVNANEAQDLLRKARDEYYKSIEGQEKAKKEAARLEKERIAKEEKAAKEAERANKAKAVKSLKTKSTLNKILVPVALGVGVFTGYQIAK